MNQIDGEIPLTLGKEVTQTIYWGNTSKLAAVASAQVWTYLPVHPSHVV